MSSNHQDSKEDADTDGQAFQAEDNALHYGEVHEQAIQHDDDFSLLLSGVEKLSSSDEERTYAELTAVQPFLQPFDPVESDEEFGQGSDEVLDDHAIYDAIFAAKPPKRGDLHLDNIYIEEDCTSMSNQQFSNHAFSSSKGRAFGTFICC